MNRFILALLIILSCAVLPKIAFAKLDTCDETTYCDEDKDKGIVNGLIKKTGCQVTDEKALDACRTEKGGSACDVSDFRGTGEKVCTCIYQTIVSGSCINPGGTKNTTTEVGNVFDTIKSPVTGPIGYGKTGIMNIIGKVIQMFYIVAGIGAVFMFLWSGLQLVISGGDKEALGTARKRITWAIIGLVVLALTFPILKVLGDTLNIPIVG